jgi:hypothetical protein
MRIAPFLAFIGAATVSLSAFADSSIPPAVAAGSLASVQVKAAHTYLSKGDAEHMRGTFELTDGRTITVTNRMNKLFVDLDGKREELVPVGATKFVTRDTGTRVAFDRVPYAAEVVVDQAAR